MLIVNVFVNNTPIDDLFVHNMGIKKNGISEYEIIDHKTGERVTEKTIAHKRSDGYRPLLIKVLQLLEEEKIEEKIIDRQKAYWIKTALEEMGDGNT